MKKALCLISFLVLSNSCTGPQGPQGIQGIQGNQGIQGPQGTPSDIYIPNGEYFNDNGLYKTTNLKDTVAIFFSANSYYAIFKRDSSGSFIPVISGDLDWSYDSNWPKLNFKQRIDSTDYSSIYTCFNNMTKLVYTMGKRIFDEDTLLIQYVSH